MKVQMSYRLVKWVMLGVTALLFVMPWMQRTFHLFKFDDLKGWHASVQQPSITLASWISGAYQKDFDAYSADSFGFTPPLVRTINQIDYTLFKTANAQYVTVGKDAYLYETAYIDAVMGLDYVGKTIIDERCKKLSEVNAILQSKGKHIVVVLAPGKASFFPEFIPDYYQKYRRDTTNYSVYLQSLKKHEVPCLDFSSWFKVMKDTSMYGLYPQTGIHWSTYGMAVAGDSIMKYLSKITSKQLPSYKISFGDETTNTRKSDSDVEDGMNLWQKLQRLPMMYPKIEYDTTGTQKLKTVVVADSYFWGLYDHGFSTMATDGAFYYYFQDIYPQNIKAEALDLRTELLKQDVIIIMATDATLPKFGWGFVEKAWLGLSEN